MWDFPQGEVVFDHLRELIRRGVTDGREGQQTKNNCVAHAAGLSINAAQRNLYADRALKTAPHFLLTICGERVTIAAMSRFIILALAAFSITTQFTRGATTVIPLNSSWKYWKGTSEASSPVNAWRGLLFSDSGWITSTAPFFYGETASGTVLSDMQGVYSCVFMRKTFNIDDPGALEGLRLDVQIDDGFVAWINGTEVFRYNMPSGDPARSTLALSGIEPELRSIILTNPTSLLVAGQNVIAVQGFNNSLAGSSDFLLDAALTSYAPDSVPPAIASVTPTRGGTLTALTEITVTFDEPVAGVTAGALVINGFPAGAVSGADTSFTFSFAQPPYGLLQISWSDQHTIADGALNPNRFDHTAAGASWTYNLVDELAPTIVSYFPAPGAAVRSLAQVELTFSEGVLGVDAADLLMNGQPATNLNHAGGGPYVFQFPAPASGEVQMSWVGNPGIVDVAQPPNAFAPTNWSYVLDPNAGVGDLVITEILAANESGLIDEDGEAQDWIEIYNRGSRVLDLAGWSLSDDEAEPGRWVFPSWSMGPGTYLIVFASGKDRKNPSGQNRLHTNFRLATDGEFLGLYSPDSPRTLASGFSPTYPEQRNDHSFGYDSEGALRYFATPTPGAPNGTSTILSVTEPVHFSVERGFYSNAFELHLSSPTYGSAIRYTLDGVEPTLATGTIYSGPLRVTNTTIVRAVAFRPNFLPSLARTHSYLFNFTPAQRALPVMNLVMPLSNWFGRSGILGMGGGSRAADGLYITNNVATDYHNPSQHGIAWERPVSAEYILPQDNSGFQIDCGIRVQGSDWQRPRTTLDSKFSYRLYFRGDYGQGKLEYPIFPLSTAPDFDQLVLRAGFNEQVNPFIRDEIIRRLSQDMGQIASVGGLALVLRNGGVYTNNTGLVTAYNLCERVTSSMLHAKFGGSEEWDVVAPSFAVSAEGLGVIDGDRVDFQNLLTNVWTGSAVRQLTNQAAYMEVARRLDLPNFVDYCLLNAYTAMGDWPANNWRAARERSTNGIWRFIVWDAEWGMGIYALAVSRDSFSFSGTGTEDAGLNSTGNSEIARLYQGLRANREFRLLWADRIHKHFFNGGALMGLNISNRFNELGAQLQPSFSPPAAMDIEILQWARDRYPIVMNQFNLYGLYGYSNMLYGVFASSNAPVFNQHGGRIGAGFGLTMAAPQGGTIYYTLNGDDPRVPFSGAVSNSAATYSGPVTISQSTVVKARTLLNETNWSALAEAEFKVDSLIVPLRITEIMYNPSGGRAYEFIELLNYGATPLDVSGITFDGIAFTFLENTILAPGARIVLSSDENPGAFSARYPGLTVAGLFSGQLDNAGETIVLKDASGKTIHSVTYDDEGLWPRDADGTGHSLVLADNSGDPDDPLNWTASLVQGGSPGAGDIFPPPPAGVVISEVNAGSSPQWIELHNPTGAGINLAGYSLTDDSQARKFVLPSISIAAGSYAVIQNTNLFTLNARGDEVLLYNAQTNLISKVSFGLQPAGYTLSLAGGNWTLGNPTPNAANAAATLGSPSALVINEWLANALSSEDDWIELWNNSAEPVALRGVYVGVSNALFRIGSLSFIGPFGFAQLFADEDAGPDHLDFRLPSTGGRMAIYDTIGLEINNVTYGNQAENVSQGRLPDGSSTLQTFAGSASPGASNFVFTYSGPYINEVMARNVSAITNGAGATADWIELYNPTPGAVDLSGMSLSVDAPEPGQWVFPSGSTIPATGYLIIWCDADSATSTTFGPTLNCGQSLNGDSGGVYLFSTAGQVVNFIEYGFQIQNQSIGRIGALWRLLQTFTPAAANSTAATLGSVNTVTFNEWMADPVRGDDWFELYNPATQPVDLGGLALTDDPSLAGLNKFRIPGLSFISAKGWVRYQADGNPGAGFDHVNFSLDAGGETLRLHNPSQLPPITSVYLGPQEFGVSEGRLPDGAAGIARFPGSATPGDSNYQLPGRLTINELLASTDQVELHNPSAETASIGGWFLSNSRTDYKLYRIPDGTSVPGGGYLVLTPTFDLPLAGGEIILAAADAAGNLNGQRVHAAFGVQDAGVSFGRFVTSQGIEFVALAQPTLGAANANALVGPIVINEIMYNPVPGESEYIELHNVSSSEVSLNGWALANAVRASLTGEILPAGGFLSVFILPEYGRLDNASDRIDLIKPGGILVDSVGYADSTPWPSGLVDGGGLSLQRRNATGFGNEPLNWLASEPTSGSENGPGTIALPVVDVPPQSQTVPADTVLTLSLEASGGPPLTYQWRLDGNEIPGANSPELPLGFVQLEHTGVYDVLVSNPAGTTLSPAANVVVETVPLILVPPQNQAVPTNATVTLSVGVRASAPITYEWRFNGTPIPGATSSSYTFANAALSHVGDYSVHVSNPLGSVSATAYVAVLIPPSFTLQPLTQTVVEGDDATFRAAVTGLPPFAFRWRRPGVSAITNAIGYDTPIITITNVPLSYSNNTIDCIASNPVRPAPGGVQSTIVRLYVLPDGDGDRLPNSWETANGFNINDPADAAADTDGDGISNRDEYLGGTNPNDATSFLRVQLMDVNLATPAALLSFNAASNKTYTVQYRDALADPEWFKLMHVEGALTNRTMRITDPSPSAPSRFYRLITPATR